MASNLPNPSDFDNLFTPQVEKFPKNLPPRPGKTQSYLGSIVRNNKLRIIICTVCFLAMIGGTVAAALFISRGIQRVNQGQAVLSSTPLQSTTTKTITQTSGITVSASGLQSTVHAVATTAPGPAITCSAKDNGLPCGSLAQEAE